MNNKSGLLFHARHGLVALSAVLLMACGGGSGGGESTSGIAYDGPTAVVAINEGNAENLAGAVFDSIQGLGVAMESGMLMGVAEQGDNASLDVDLAEFLHAQAMRIIQRDHQQLSLQGITESDSEPCGFSGSVSYSATFASYDEDTVGDRFTLSYSNCRDWEDGPTVNGSMTMTLTQITGDQWADNWALAFSIGFNQLTFSQDGSYATLHGGMLFELAETPTQFTIRMSGKEFLVIGSSASIRHRNFEQYMNDDFNVNEISMGFNTTVASTLIGGEVIVTTEEEFVIASSDWYPGSGVLHIAGGNGSSLRLTALNGETGLVRLDWADGMGNAGQLDVYWEEISNSEWGLY